MKPVNFLLTYRVFLTLKRNRITIKKFAQIDSYLDKSRYPYGPCVIKTNKYCLKIRKKD